MDTTDQPVQGAQTESPATANGTPPLANADPQTRFCPSCGQALGEQDRFCRACGAPATADTPPKAAGVPTEDEPRRSRRTRVLVGAGLTILLLAVAAALVLTLGASSGPSAAQRHQHLVVVQRRAAAEQQAAFSQRLSAPFDQAMGLRTRFFIAERSFLSAMDDANSKLGQYQSDQQNVQQQDQQITNANSAQENACSQPGSFVACPNPTYPNPPTAPDVSRDISRLHSVVSRLAGLNAQALAVTPQPELKVFYAQLEAATTALSSDAQANADTLTQGVTAPDQTSGSTGSVDTQKTATLRHESAVPAVRIMNQQAVSLIGQLHLTISQYDVPGGTDADPTDHSTLS